MAEVEFIRKDIDGASFHRGVLVDVDPAKGGLVQVAAAEGADERRWIRKNAMRLARDTATLEGFAPQVGELVEVQVIDKKFLDIKRHMHKPFTVARGDFWGAVEGGELSL